MYYQVIFDFDDGDSDPHYSIRPKVSEDVSQDNTVVLIDPVLAERHGTALDNRGFPTSASLEAWHREHNPQLFTD